MFLIVLLLKSVYMKHKVTNIISMIISPLNFGLYFNEHLVSDQF
jgi:Mg2+/citrate symporter